MCELETPYLLFDMTNYECKKKHNHTADIQVHAWGITLEEAFVASAMAMCNYMFDQSAVTIDSSQSKEFEIEECSSLNKLLFNFLEEVLYIFSCDSYLAIGDIKLENHISVNESGNYTLSGICHGEVYDRKKHQSRTEIKAVTYSNMRIIQDSPEGLVHIYLIFDI